MSNRLSNKKSALFTAVGFFPGLKSHYLPCRPVLMAEREGECLATDPEVGHIITFIDNRASCFTFSTYITIQIFIFIFLNRCISRFRNREAAFPPPVLGLHVGQRHRDASPPAHAQHRSATGFSGPHSENGGDQVRPPHYVGGLWKPNCPRVDFCS